MIGSRFRPSEFQMDMRNIPALMPEVQFIGHAQEKNRVRVAVKHDGLYWADTGIALLREKLLIESVRSILDNRCSKRTWEDVTSWMMTDNDDSNPFSFNNCCEQIGVDPERYRDAVTDLVASRRPDQPRLKTEN